MTKEELEKQRIFIEEVFTLTEILTTTGLSFKDNLIVKESEVTVSQHQVFWLMTFIWDYLRNKENSKYVPLTIKTFRKLFSLCPTATSVRQEQDWESFKESIYKSVTPLNDLADKVKACSSQALFIFPSQLPINVSDYAKNEILKTTILKEVRSVNGIEFKVVYIALILSIYCREQTISIDVQNEIYIKLFLATKQQSGRKAVLDALKSYGYKGTTIKDYIEEINSDPIYDIANSDKYLKFLLSEKDSEPRKAVQESINLITGRLFHIGKNVDDQLATWLEVSPEGNTLNDNRIKFIKGLVPNNLAYAAILIFHRNCLPSNNYDLKKNSSSSLTKDGENVYWWLSKVWNKG